MYFSLADYFQNLKSTLDGPGRREEMRQFSQKIRFSYLFDILDCLNNSLILSHLTQYAVAKTCFRYEQ